MTIGKKIKFYIISVLILTLGSKLWASNAIPNGYAGLDTDTVYAAFSILNSRNTDQYIQTPVTPPDTGLRSPIPQPINNPLNEENPYTPFHLKDPSGMGTNIEYDPESNTYKFQNMIGSTPYGPGAYMDVNEYIDYDLRQEINRYWREKSKITSCI